ncbi:MAG: hypothetical protein FWC41_04655 [Firmicutes bacterium]|nr:hypothetical protein [Bacillota bacterium]
MNKKMKLTELNKLDNLCQDGLLKITGGAAPGSGCCCSCNSCTCNDESCDEDSKLAASHKKNSGSCAR